MRIVNAGQSQSPGSRRNRSPQEQRQSTSPTPSQGSRNSRDRHDSQLDGNRQRTVRFQDQTREGQGQFRPGNNRQFRFGDGPGRGDRGRGTGDFGPSYYNGQFRQGRQGEWGLNAPPRPGSPRFQGNVQERGYCRQAQFFGPTYGPPQQDNVGQSPGNLQPVSYTHLTLPTNREV